MDSIQLFGGSLKRGPNPNAVYDSLVLGTCPKPYSVWQLIKFWALLAEKALHHSGSSVLQVLVQEKSKASWDHSNWTGDFLDSKSHQSSDPTNRRPTQQRPNLPHNTWRALFLYKPNVLNPSSVMWSLHGPCSEPEGMYPAVMPTWRPTLRLQLPKPWKRTPV